MEDQSNMSEAYRNTLKMINELKQEEDLNPSNETMNPPSIAELKGLSNKKINWQPTAEGRQKRLEFLKNENIQTNLISGETPVETDSCFQGNIENFIGMAQIPIGLGGPLLINGTNAKGTFYVPLATTEGALVASYNRGMKACRLSGGVTTAIVAEGVQRSPLFHFDDLYNVGLFVQWVSEKLPHFKELIREYSRYAQLQDMKVNMEGSSVILTFEYHTGDAAGQNMVTICTNAVCLYIEKNYPNKINHWYIESNYSGDKKATHRSFNHVRGKKVIAEVLLPKEVVVGTLKTTAEKLFQGWLDATMSIVQSGAIGAQGHVANGLTAMFIACGQDVACVSEAAIGMTRMELTPQGDLYASVTLPALIVGTVGGGTSLPTQRQCLEMMDCYGAGKANKFAEICCAVALAGELSIGAALCAHHFAEAHAFLGRKRV